MPDEQPTITVRGLGRVERAPDVADITLVVEATRRTATSARDVVATAARQVLEAARAAGIADRDLRTASIDIQPAWEHDERGRAHRAGVTVVHRLAVRVRDLDAVGQTLDATLDAGATGVDMVSLGILDRSAAETEARRLAVLDARAHAETIADAAGVRLGAVVAIAEGGADRPIPMPLARMAKFDMAEASGTPVEGGVLEVSVAVTASWAIA